MDLYQEILAYAFWQYGIQGKSPELCVEPHILVEGTCYQALEKIRAIMEDESLDDPVCFKKMEAIVNALEEQGIFTSRHDFG